MTSLHSQAPTQPLSLLVVEDDDVDREKLLRLLARLPLDLRVSETGSAQEALALIEGQSFNCAILDYHLRDALGSELIAALQTHTRRPIPIIMVSGNSDERLVADLMREGIFDYLPKRNLAIEQLQQTLEQGLAWAEQQMQLDEQRRRLHELAEGLPHLVWTSLPDGRCDYANRRWCEYTGKLQEEQLGLGWIEQIHPDDQAQMIECWMECINSGNPLQTVYRLRGQGGDYRWFDTRALAQRNSQGEVLRWIASSTDVHERELIRQALASSEQRFLAAFEYAPLGMALVNLQGQLVQANSAFYHLLDIDEEPQPPLHMAELSHNHGSEQEQGQLRALHSQQLPFVQFEKQLHTRHGQVITTQVSVALLNQHAQDSCYLYQFYDLSERKHYEEELLKLAHHDPLTGLANRTKLLMEIQFLIQHSHRGGAPFALLFGDLDHFKQINDGLGHEAGDLLLRTVARRLQKALRRGDNVARLGGDEFVVLLQDVNRFESVVSVAEKLIQAIHRPIRLGRDLVHVGISFGIALYPTDGDDAATLLRNADSALYDAKAKGRGCIQLYRKELTDYVHNRLMLDASLRTALSLRQFELYYQPVIDLHSGQVRSVEALIRWNHPQRGLVGPDEFIAYSQESGLIVRLGDWVIEQACQQLASWRQRGLHLPIAINVSARQFAQNNLPEKLTQALANVQVPSDQLVIEITEQLLLENTQQNIAQINQLKNQGLRIALDDFGVGYSSLSYILRFAPHYLKIDRSFINQIGQTPEGNAMVQAIIGLRQVIPMQLIAEGVETEAQEQFLLDQGCGLAQGYKYARPLPLAELEQVVAQRGLVQR